MSKNASLTTGPIGPTLLHLTGPMVVGIFAITVFHLADTYFVAQLGTEALAAISFTFPVVFFVISIALGLGMGSASVVSRAIGAGDAAQVRRLATQCLVLALAVVVLLLVIGLLTLDRLFLALGAPSHLLEPIRAYMLVWMPGMVFVVVPMVGNSIIRATGDTKWPSLTMVVAALLNGGLDPVLIFGLWGVPALGLTGAALATVLGRSVTMVLALAILHWREGLIEFALPPLPELLRIWRKVLYVALPAAGVNLLMPLTQGLLTRLVSDYGATAVAAYGVGTRIEAFALMVPMALATVLVPVVGQNWGAGEYRRVCAAQRFSYRFSLISGAVAALLLLLGGGWLARRFSDVDLVVADAALYLAVVPVGYGAHSICRMVATSFNAINRPLSAALFTGVRMLVLTVPLAALGSRHFGLIGLLGALPAVSLLAAAAGVLWQRHLCPVGTCAACQAASV